MAQSQTDIAVIGAGPQALTLVTHILQKRAKLRDRIQVFDPSGTWLTQWQQQFAAQEIPELRSPAVHHPDPNAHALRTFAEGRYDELHPPYDRPGTGLFQDFCNTVVQRWQIARPRYPSPGHTPGAPIKTTVPISAHPLHRRHGAGAAGRVGDRRRTACLAQLDPANQCHRSLRAAVPCQPSAVACPQVPRGGNRADCGQWVDQRTLGDRGREARCPCGDDGAAHLSRKAV
jgi:hypothetical protein